MQNVKLKVVNFFFSIYRDYDRIANSAMHVVNQKLLNIQNVIVLQPYVKWGPKKMKEVKPENQLAEAESLIRTLNWNVEVSMKVPLDSMSRRMIFGSGKLDELKQIINQRRAEGRPLTCMFVSKSVLKFVQKVHLANFFDIPVMDRYSIVVQILRMHALTNEARLQVALAEIPYIWAQLRDIETQQNNQGQNLYITEAQKMMLKKREKNIQQELEGLRAHRELLRNKRKQKQFPVVAVVGYTNCGKTSLIKALTGETSLQPRNQLFATLDVTAHAGLLPCRLEVLYMDTVGFMSDLPTGLIECFVATLEDALDADIIIHVQDISHEDWQLQRDHVEKTLLLLMTKKLTSNSKNSENLPKMDNLINIGNKVDLLENKEGNEKKDFGNLKVISSTTFAGINDLVTELEERILDATNRSKITFRVPMGTEEMQWLYKNSAVTSSEADPKDNQKILLHVVISKPTLEQFKHRFIDGRK